MKTSQTLGQKRLGQRIAWFRARSGDTQESLAKTSGVSKRHINFIEQGKVNPSQAVVAKLVKAMNVSLSEFYAGAAPIEEYNKENTEAVERFALLLTSTRYKESVQTVVDAVFAQAVAIIDPKKRGGAARKRRLG